MILRDGSDWLRNITCDTAGMDAENVIGGGAGCGRTERRRIKSLGDDCMKREDFEAILTILGLAFVVILISAGC